MERLKLVIPGYKTDVTDEEIEKSAKLTYYSLDGIPEAYIKKAPDFDGAALALRDFLRERYPHGSLCVRGVCVRAHNAANGTAKTAEDIIEIIRNLGTDRYNPPVKGEKYDNVENKKIDFFAYDVFPYADDGDLTYFFQSFYYYGIKRTGKPDFVDILTVYDRTKLDLVEHRYAGRSDIKRDGFAFREDCGRQGCVLGIIEIKTE